jgi:hypothetical protein
MFESGVFRARALAAGGRYAAGMLRPVRRCATQSVAAAPAAFSNADAGELPADGAQALKPPQNSGERARPTRTPGGLERIPKQ